MIPVKMFAVRATCAAPMCGALHSAGGYFLCTSCAAWSPNLGGEPAWHPIKGPCSTEHQQEVTP